MLLSHRPFRAGDPDWDDCLDSFVTSIKDSAESSEGRSMAPDPVHGRRRSSHQSHLTSITTHNKEYEYSDSGVAIPENLEGGPKEFTAIPHILGADILPKTLQEVERCLREGRYHDAADTQKRAIDYRQRFAGDTPVSTEVMCRDDMRLAEIYRQMTTPQGLSLAEVTLCGVVDRLEPVELDPPGLKNSLLGEIYHDLGRICIQLENPSAGSRHLSNAFDFMVESEEHTPLLRSVGTMLYRIYIKMNTPEVAEVLDQNAERRSGFSLKTLAWCQEQGFDTEHESFRFDRCDVRVDSPVKGMAPLHVAAKQGQDDILRHMLRGRQLNLEVTDHQDHATPFLLACSQQDIIVIDLLLHHGANPTKKDKLHRNGLHLCQRGTGGTLVARRLLSHPPSVDINAADSHQTTPLHQAASMGNFKMIVLLLGSGAGPNIQGPGGYTPLMGAVQATMKSQEARMEVLKVLVSQGADASLEYSGGQTAADMANDGQVRKALKEWAKQGKGQGGRTARRFTLPWKS